MSYTKQTWTNGSSYLSAERLNHIEDGLEAAASVADSARTTANAAMPKSGSTFTGTVIHGNNRPIKFIDSTGAERNGMNLNSSDYLNIGDPAIANVTTIYGGSGASGTNGSVKVGNSANPTDLSVTGDIFAGGHSSAIGSVVTGTVSTQTCTTAGTDYQQATISLTAGVWVISGYARFTNMGDSTYRVVSIQSASGNPYPNVSTQVPAVNGTNTIVGRDRIVSISETTTYYLYTRSGTAATPVSAANLTAVRIA